MVFVVDAFVIFVSKISLCAKENCELDPSIIDRMESDLSSCKAN